MPSPQQNGQRSRVPLRATASAAQSLGARDPRARRNAQALTDPAMTQPPLGVNTQGQLELRIGGAINLDANGNLTVLIGAPLAVQAGSPEKIVLVIESESLQVVKGKLAARPDARHVRSVTPGFTSGTVADELRAADLARRAASERFQANERAASFEVRRRSSVQRMQVAQSVRNSVIERRSFH